MAFRDIIQSNKELKKLVDEMKELEKESDLIDTQLDTARDQVDWKDKLNIFTQSEEEKQVKSIRGQLGGVQQQINDRLTKVISGALQERIKEDPNYLFQVMLRVLENIKDRADNVSAELVTGGEGEERTTTAEVRNKKELEDYVDSMINASKGLAGKNIPTASSDFLEIGNEIQREINTM